MTYTDTKAVTVAKREVKKPLADNIRLLTAIPQPKQSTRDYFAKLNLSELTDATLDVPMNVGVETAEGKLISIWEVEKLRATLEGSEKIAFRPFVKVDKEDIDQDTAKCYTYINEDTAVGHIGTNGARFKTADGAFITLRWAMTEATVSVLPDGAKYAVNDDGVLVTAIGVFQGTLLESYYQTININDLHEELENIIYVKPNTWYWLPHKNTLTDKKLLSALQGKHCDIIQYDDSSGAESTRYNDNMKNALLAYLSSKAKSLTSITYTSSYDIEEERLRTEGEGQLLFEAPRSRPQEQHRIPKPPEYDSIKALWLNRLPLSLILDVIMIKGFNISSPYHKKSGIFASLPSNWAKTTGYAKAMKNNNLLSFAKFSRLVNTIGEGDRVGSIDLKTLYRSSVVFFDEASDIGKVPLHQAADAIKDMCTGVVSGASKNQGEIRIENFPATQYMARDDMSDPIKTISESDEIDNRSLFPKFDKEVAPVVFKGYTEKDTVDTLQCLIYDMFYEKYNRLKPMTPEQRADYMEANFVLEEEEFDRERLMLESRTQALVALVDIAASTIFKTKSFRQTLKGGEITELRDYALVDLKGGVSITKATKYQHGIHYHMQSVLELSPMFSVVQRANFKCMAKLRARQDITIPATELGESYRTKSNFYIPLDRTEIPHKIEAFDKLALSKIHSPKLIEAYKNRDILPFIDSILDRTMPSTEANTLIVGMYYHWSHLEVIEPEEAESGFIF